MSFKVYNAYRIVSSDPMRTMWLIRDRAFDNVVEALDKTGCSLDELRSRYVNQIAQAAENEHDYSVNMVVHQDRGDWFLRTFCSRTSPTRDVFSFLEHSRSVKPFNYTDQIDPPPQQLKEWEHRRQVWSRHFSRERLRQFEIPVCSVDLWYSVAAAVRSWRCLPGNIVRH